MQSNAQVFGDWFSAAATFYSPPTGLTLKSGFVLGLELDLSKSDPWICSGMTVLSKSISCVFVYSHHTCFSFQIKFTGFKFTRVSFWHISNHHNDWSDLVRSVCVISLVLVKFRSSSDLVFLFTSSRNCFKTASLASSDRFSSTEGGDRTRGASAEKHLRLIICVTWPISQEIKCWLYFRARGKYDAGLLKFFRNVLHNPQLGSRKKSHLCPFSQLLFPQSCSHQLWHQRSHFRQSRARAPHCFLTSKTSWKSESLRWRSRLHLAKFRFYIGRHLFTKCRGSRFTFYLFFFLHHFTCRRRWATGSWSSSAGGSGRSLAPWKSWWWWWWWWWWLQIVVMVTIMMKRLELCHRAAHLAHAGRHVRQGAVHVSGHWPAAGGNKNIQI